MSTSCSNSLLLVCACACVAACGSNYDLETSYAYAPADAASGPGGGFQFTGDATTSADTGSSDRSPSDTVEPQHGGDAADSAADASANPAPTDVAAPSDDAAPANPACSGFTCATPADCPASLGGAPGSCTLVVCAQGCCVATQAIAGSSCDDGDPCTVQDTCVAGACSGVAKSCDDGLDCTVEGCVADGTCQSSVQAGFCRIDGACVAIGTVAAGGPCMTCQPAIAADKWTQTPGCCLTATDCPAAGPCDKALCDPSTGKCSIAKNAGCCESDAQCDDGNACTTETCSAATGACTYVPKVCADPNVCQQAACDPQTGSCKAALKPGFCFIGGQCVPGGNADPWKKCMRCIPGQAPDQYTAAVGQTCDDGNVCTATDVCAANGSCVGVKKASCCSADADCVAPAPCVASECDVQVHVCIEKPKPACCASGVCCHVPTHSIQSAGALCPGGPLAVQYQCSGTTINKRETHPGCDGKSANGCGSSAANNYQSSWTKLKDCPAGYVCKAAASGQQPTCEKTQTSGGSCKGICGTYDATRACQCDSECGSYGDCCADHGALCGGNGCGATASATCKGACGKYTTGAACQCDAACKTFSDCCSDYKVCGC